MNLRDVLVAHNFSQVSSISTFHSKFIGMLVFAHIWDFPHSCERFSSEKYLPIFEIFLILVSDRRFLKSQLYTHFPFQIQWHTEIWLSWYLRFFSLLWATSYFWKVSSISTSYINFQSPLPISTSYIHFLYYGVASISRLLKIIGLFCKRAL